ncbi:MAG TPA: hypothetical protein VFA55_02270 [Candidatus Kapabacteria bacterium]|nr:hypothetical protein [Candidatus Kapabacteria bacterium]
MNKRWILFLFAIAVFPVSRSYGVPMFARKYNMPCSTCHTGDFKLNDFGGLFDVNGYQLPGTIESTPIWQSNAPAFSLLMQDRAAYQTSHDDASGLDSNKSAFNSLVATIISGGVLAPHVSYMSEYDVETSVGGELFASLEYAFVNFNNIFGTDMGQFNIRFGKARMELPIELTPEFYRAQYLIYNYPLLVSSRPLNFELQSAMYGTSVYGRWAEFPGAPFYQFALSAGDGSDIDLSGARMFYGRIAPSFSLGSVPVSVGVTGISAMQTIDPNSGDSLQNTASAYGVDWQINDPWSGQYAMYGQVIRFHNSNIQIGNTLMYQDAVGGYVELNDVVIPEKITLLLRYDFLNGQTQTATDTKQVNTTQIGLTAKYFFLPNVNVFLEGYQQSTATTLNAASGTRTAFYLSGGFFYGI